MQYGGFRSQVYTLQFNRHCQTAETLHVLTSDYTTDTVVWAVIILHDVPMKIEPAVLVTPNSSNAELTRVLNSK